MHIQVNGTPTEITPAFTAQQLVEQLELAGKRVALEVNGEIVPRSRYAEHTLRDGDQVEIIHAVGGG
jgi:sulfur carrier protein